MKNLSLILILLAGLIFTACKKEESKVGKDGIDQNDLLISGAIDTFQLETYTELEDSSVSSNTASGLLGSYNDPIFGKVTSEFYAQLRLSGFNPIFDVSAHVDSFVLGLEYRGYYGTLEPQTFEVYQLDDDLYLDSTYYAFQTKNASTPMVDPTKNVQTPNPTDKIMIADKTVDAQLRLYLDTAIARTWMNKASDLTTFASNENFLSFFKGINVKVNNPSQAEGEGAILYFNLAAPLSKLTIYYREHDTVSKTFDFLLNSECADFNHITFENSSTKPGQILSNPELGKTEFYAQANYSRAVVKIPYIKNIPKNSVIQYAKLELPVNFYTLDNYYPSSSMSVATKISLTDERLYNANVTGEYSDYTKSYVIDLKDYLQQLLINKIENRGLYFSPTKMVSSTERIVFNGSSTIYKKKPKLYIIYTTF